MTNDNSDDASRGRLLGRITALLWVVVIALVVTFFYFASSLCITVLLAGFLAILVDPVLGLLEKLHFPRSAAAALVVVFGAHESRAITEGAANAFAVQLAVLLNLLDEIGLREGGPADADDGDPAIANIGGAGLHHEFLQVTVAAADDGRIGKRPLHLFSQTEMAFKAFTSAKT